MTAGLSPEDGDAEIVESDEDVEFSFDVTAQGSARDSVIAQASYTLYAVVADGDSFAVGASSFPLSVRHSPAFEFTAPLKGMVKKMEVKMYRFKGRMMCRFEGVVGLLRV